MSRRRKFDYAAWAREYMDAAQVDARPNRLLADRHGIPVRTAQTRTYVARLAGFLPETEQGASRPDLWCPTCGAPPSAQRRNRERAS